MKSLTRPLLLLLLLLTCHLRALAQTSIPLEAYVANLKAAQVEVKGKSFRFLFDTGGGETIMSPEVTSYNLRSLLPWPKGFIPFEMFKNKISGLGLKQYQVWRSPF